MHLTSPPAGRAQVWSFFIKEKNIPKVVLDEVIGAEMRCSVVNDDRQLVVVHKDDMKFFEADDIGPCSALEGTKKQVIFYKNYYVVVTEETKDVVAEKNTITVYDWRDRRNKFIAFQTQCATVSEVVPEWGRLLVLGGTGGAAAAAAALAMAPSERAPVLQPQRIALILSEQDLPTKMKVRWHFKFSCEWVFQIVSTNASHSCVGIRVSSTSPS